MGKFKFEDNRIECKEAISDAMTAFLYEIGGEFVSQTVRNTAVSEGQLKGSWDYVVDESEFTVTIGSPLENAIWEEFGTGEYALKKNGRNTPWYVSVEGYVGKKKPTFNGRVVIVYGKDGKAFYKTNGKKPKRALWNAFQTLQPVIQSALEEKLKGIH